MQNMCKKIKGPVGHSRVPVVQLFGVEFFFYVWIVWGMHF